MDIFWTMLAGLSVFANRVAEAVKAYLKTLIAPTDDPYIQQRNDQLVSLAALLVSLAVGVVGALAFNLNVVTYLLTLVPDNPYLANVSSLAGVIMTGCFASLGSEFLQWLTDLLAAGRERLLPGEAAVIVEAEADGAKAAVSTSPPPR